MKKNSFFIKRFSVLSLSLLLAYGVSYLGWPPPKELEDETFNLKKEKKINYGPEDFALMQVYASGKEICSTSSTTAVRNYFDYSGKYRERSKIEKYFCKIPKEEDTLEIKITIPYKPDKDILTNIDTCKVFYPVKDSWQVKCPIFIYKEKQPFIFQVYEEANPTGNKKSGNNPETFNRKADRLDVTLLK